MHPTHHSVEPTPADTLRAAALYLDRHGWYQGSLYDPDTTQAFPPACALGAITIAATGEADWEALFDKQPACQAAIEVLALHLAADVPYPLVDLDDIELVEWISGWNDADERTAFEVRDAFQAAATEWDTDHNGGAA
jgi:hypothetical protein